MKVPVRVLGKPFKGNPVGSTIDVSTSRARDMIKLRMAEAVATTQEAAPVPAVRNAPRKSPAPKKAPAKKTARKTAAKKSDSRTVKRTTRTMSGKTTTKDA